MGTRGKSIPGLTLIILLKYHQLYLITVPEHTVLIPEIHSLPLCLTWNSLSYRMFSIIDVTFPLSYLFVIYLEELNVKVFLKLRSVRAISSHILLFLVGFETRLYYIAFVSLELIV